MSTKDVCEFVPGKFYRDRADSTTYQFLMYVSGAVPAGRALFLRADGVIAARYSDGQVLQRSQHPTDIVNEERMEVVVWRHGETGRFFSRVVSSDKEAKAFETELSYEHTVVAVLSFTVKPRK